MMFRPFAEWQTKWCLMKFVLSEAIIVSETSTNESSNALVFDLILTRATSKSNINEISESDQNL